MYLESISHFKKWHKNKVLSTIFKRYKLNIFKSWGLQFYCSVHCINLTEFLDITAWKMSTNKVFSGPYLLTYCISWYSKVLLGPSQTYGRCFWEKPFSVGNYFHKKLKYRCLIESQICFCYACKNGVILTLSWRRPLSYRNQCIDLPSK